MNRLESYGELPRPEEKKQIITVEDPSIGIRYAYELWFDFLHQREYRHLGDKDLYEQACDLIANAKVKSAISSRRIWNVIKDKKDDDRFEFSGYFLSALLNTTDLSELFIPETLEGIGYRIKHGKRLILGREVTKYQDTQIASDVISYGKLQSLANEAEGGLQINFGVVDAMANDANGGIQINLGGCDRMGQGASGGIQINLGIVGDMATYAEGGLQINFGQVDNIGADSHDESIIVNAGNFRYLGGDALGYTINIGELPFIGRDKKDISLSNLLEELASTVDRLLELHDLRIAHTPVRKNPNYWSSFKRRVSTICGKITEHVESNYETGMYVKWVSSEDEFIRGR